MMAPVSLKGPFNNVSTILKAHHDKYKRAYPMRPVANNAIEIIGCHAEGEVGDVIVGGADLRPTA